MNLYNQSRRDAGAGSAPTVTALMGRLVRGVRRAPMFRERHERDRHGGSWGRASRTSRDGS